MRATSSMSRAAKPMCKMPSGFNSCTSMDCCVAAFGRAMGWYGCAPTCAPSRTPGGIRRLPHSTHAEGTKRDRTVALGSTIVGEAISRHPPARSGNAIRLSTTRAAHTRRASKARARAAGLASVRQWGTDDVSTSQWQSRRRAEQVAIRQVQTAVGQRSETTVCLAKGTDAALESQAQRPELWRRHHSVAAIEPADHNGVL